MAARRRVFDISNGSLGVDTDKSLPQIEMGRLDRQHIIWTSVLDGNLVKAPVENPKRVLDLGTGSGVWATDFGKWSSSRC